MPPVHDEIPSRPKRCGRGSRRVLPGRASSSLIAARLLPRPSRSHLRPDHPAPSLQPWWCTATPRMTTFPRPSPQARWTAPTQQDAAVRHGGYARSAQRSAVPRAVGRGEERCLGGRGLRAGGLLRRFSDSRIPHRPCHRPQINGLPIAGEQDVPLENKERVEILKGIAGVESGVSSAGGLINFVTKRPATIKAIDLATDHRGSAYGAVDLGRSFRRREAGRHAPESGRRKNPELCQRRRRMARNGRGRGGLENHAEGHSQNGFRISAQGAALGQRIPVAGRHNGPDLNRFLLPPCWANSPGASPTHSTPTIPARVSITIFIPRGARSRRGSFSHSLIDDNVVYAYGCGYQQDCYSSGGASPDYFFGPNGGYDIYDYRNPGELRVNAVAQSLLLGRVKTGTVMHELAGGGEMFLRSVKKPG